MPAWMSASGAGGLTRWASKRSSSWWTSTRGLVPAVGDVLAVSDISGLRVPELFQSCVEMVTPVFSDVAELARRLPSLRREVAYSCQARKWPPSFLELSGPKDRLARPGLAVATGPGLQ